MLRNHIISITNVTAYKEGSKVVVVVINSGSSALTQTFRIENGTVVTFTPHTTTEFQNCVEGTSIALTNNSFSVTLEAESVTTFVSN